MDCQDDRRPAVPTRPLNATAASLLGFLHEGPMTGWDLVERAQERIGDFWTVTRSQVYRELAAMASDALIERGPERRGIVVPTSSPKLGGRHSPTGSDRSRAPRPSAIPFC